jgi:hypothetical protein
MNVKYMGMVALLTAIAAPVPGIAQGGGEVRIYATTAPPTAPPAKVAPAPAAKVGYIWSSGYWTWNGSSYVWTEGSWVAVVQAKKWIPPTWTQEGSKWYFTAGHWG